MTKKEILWYTIYIVCGSVNLDKSKTQPQITYLNTALWMASSMNLPVPVHMHTMNMGSVMEKIENGEENEPETKVVWSKIFTC